MFKNKSKSVKLPYFIGFFVLAVIANTYIPAVNFLSPGLLFIAKAGLTLTLFLIGAGLSRNVLMSVGFKPLLQGVVLWVMISGVALYAVIHWA